MSFAIGAALGFLVGWLIFKRPETVTRWIENIKTRFGW